MRTTSIHNGTICLDDGFRQTDLFIEQGIIASIGELPAAQKADLEIDATGLFVLPGLIDIHTHLDDVIAGYPLADSYRSGTEAAIRNGITSIGTFITQERSERLPEAIGRAQTKALNNCYTDYLWHLTPTRFDEAGWNDIETAIENGFSSIKLYTTYRQAGICSSYDQIERIFKRLAPRGVQFLIHCEDEELLAAIPPEVYDLRTPLTHATLRPPEAETVAIGRLLTIGRSAGAKMHIVHVSTPEGVELIAAVRGSQMVTCETCPHYLVLNQDMLSRPDGSRWLCSPPLRDERRRQTLTAYAEMGMVDIFATDHCAFHPTDKDRWSDDFRTVPNGIAGIGALPHLVYDLYRSRGDEAMLQLAAHCSAEPAKVLQLYPRKGSIRPGADADLAIVGLHGGKRPIRSSLSDAYESYPGRQATLSFEYVLHHGTAVVKDNELLPGIFPKGNWLCPV
jgi:dihydropyrimidinase